MSILWPTIFILAKYEHSCQINALGPEICLQVSEMPNLWKKILVTKQTK